MTSEAPPPIIFLSSVFYEVLEAESVELQLRRQIIERAHSLPIDLRAHDFSASPIGSRSLRADSIIDRCFEDIKQCDLFVFLQTRRHGSGVLWREADPTTATYLEMELFAAALLQKPILVLHERGWEAEPRLADLLRILRASFGETSYFVGNQADLLTRFGEAVRCLRAPGIGRTVGKVPAAVPDALSRLRSLGGTEEDLSDPTLFFLAGWPEAVSPGGDLDRARRLLDDVAAGNLTPERPMSHGASLFRIWAALRELLPLDRRDAAVAQQWDRTLGLWSTKASWFGVHGHIYLGPLAAVNSQIQLRRGEAQKDSDLDSREPLGARASALYSLGQRMVSRERKLRHFTQAAMQATAAIGNDADGQSGALAIRGHAALRIARLGRPWRAFDARRDFSQVLAMREHADALPASIGEAQTDLGLSMIFVGRPFKGLALMIHGVELLREDQSANGIGFLTRGLRMLELGARLTMRRSLARAVREERLNLARSVDALDQVRER